MQDRIIDAAQAIRAQRYADADAVFAAGSIVRGEGTAFSDLDLVVVYGRVERAYRESFRFGGWPVEAFVHDPATLDYFFQEVDGPAGVPALAQMVFEGVEVPQATELSRALKRRASAFIAAGPPALDAESERRLRYFVSDLVDDLRAPRSPDELIGTGAQLYEHLANWVLRRRGAWSAKGKALPRVLRRSDAGLGSAYCAAFRTLFTSADPAAVVRLADELLAEAGGPLFDGFRIDAPPNWRKQPEAEVRADQAGTDAGR